MKKFPDWLQEHKNEWVTFGGLQKIMRSPHLPFSSWFQSVRPRLKVISVPHHGKSGASHKYLVKQVWAFAQAHNVELEPTSWSIPRADLVSQLDHMEAEVKRLRMGKLENEKVNIIVRPWQTENLTSFLADFYKMLICATGPMPHPGVYFLFEGEEIVYVGQSGNVLVRMAGHAQKQFDAIKMIRIDDQKQRFEMESKLISMFNPKLNIQGRKVEIDRDKLHLEVVA